MCCSCVRRCCSYAEYCDPVHAAKAPKLAIRVSLQPTAIVKAGSVKMPSPAVGRGLGAAFFMPQLLPKPKRVTAKQGTRMKNPRCLLAAPVLAGRTQITALGTKPRLSLVACVFLVLAVPVSRVQAQSNASPPNAAASFVSGHLQCVAYYATMSDCLSRFSQKDETRYVRRGRE